MSADNIQRFLDGENRITVWPKKHQGKELVVAYLATKFEFGKTYHERDINEILK